jgi:AcrR family transcriptional regulator
MPCFGRFILAADVNVNVYIDPGEAKGARRRRRLGVSGVTHEPVSGVAEFQRARLLKAALEVASEHGYQGMPATVVVARAGVSRKTFYELFESRDDCYMAVLEDSFAQIARVVLPAYKRQSKWSEALRAGLVELLAYLEREPEIGAFVLSYAVGHGPRHDELRACVLAQLQAVVEAGCTQGKPRHGTSPLSGEVIVGSVVAVLHQRLQVDPRDLSDLANPLMWMIVLPYGGQATAARELCRPAPKHAQQARRLEGDQPPVFSMRLTYRTARVLEVIADTPGMSNILISAQAEILDQGQTSKLLSRLARLGLIENSGSGRVGRAANAWHLTDRGREFESAIRRRSALRER